MLSFATKKQFPSRLKPSKPQKFQEIDSSFFASAEVQYDACWDLKQEDWTDRSDQIM